MSLVNFEKMSIQRLISFDKLLKYNVDFTKKYATQEISLNFSRRWAICL